MATLSQLGEMAILDRLLPTLPSNPDVIVGPGDDCAVLRRDDDWDSLYKTDVVIENVHFTKTTPPHLIGRKALARALSDIAAMGGIPEHALVSLLIHSSRTIEYVEELYKGISHLAEEWEVSIAGGETSSLPYDSLIINICMLGKVPRNSAILRNTAQVGDLIAVTGELGDSFETGHHLSFTPRIREGIFLREQKIATAMMDISDGLAIDLKRLSQASGVSFFLNHEHLPCRNNCSSKSALHNGEDYELVFSLNPKNLPQINQLNQHQLLSNARFTIIGEIIQKSLQQNDSSDSGWQHFVSD